MRNTIRFFCLAVAAAFCLYGCTSTPKEEETGSIYGVITDKATGEPVKSAGVQLNPGGTKTVTGNEGQYEFVELPSGDYTLHVTKTGYTDLTAYKITVIAGKTNKGDVQIEKLPPSLRVVDDKTQDIDVLDFGDAADDLTRSFSIFNDGSESLEWEISVTADWIAKVSKENGTLKAGATQAIIVTIDRDLLAGGENTTSIHITSDNGSKQITVKVINSKKTAQLNILETTDITASTAIFNGNIIEEGYPKYSERGFVYSISPMPTIETTISKITAASTTTAKYSAVATDLILDQKYYVRAYAINSIGIAYSSNEVNFMATAVMPTVATLDVTNKQIGMGLATFNGNISNIGDPPYTERGFVYGLTHNPTVDDNTRKIVSGNGVGVFSSNMSELTMGMLYYVRAYATNIKGTVYGGEIVCDFTPIAPEVTTQAVTNINGKTATFNGTIVSIGDPYYTERGFVYGVTANPTLDDNKQIVSGINTGHYNCNINNLIVNDTYSVRAYAIYGDIISYGNTMSFKAESPYYFVVNNLMVQKTDISDSSISYSSAKNICENSNIAGVSGWRIPTIGEASLLFSKKDELGTWGTKYNYTYWSSTQISEYWEYYNGAHLYYRGVKIISMQDGLIIDNWARSKYGVYSTFEEAIGDLGNYRARCVRTLD